MSCPDQKHTLRFRPQSGLTSLHQRRAREVREGEGGCLASVSLTDVFGRRGEEGRVEERSEGEEREERVEGKRSGSEGRRVEKGRGAEESRGAAEVNRKAKSSHTHLSASQDE